MNQSDLVGDTQKLPDIVVSEKSRSLLDTMIYHEPSCTPYGEPLASDISHRPQASLSMWLDPSGVNDNNKNIQSELVGDKQKLPGSFASDKPGSVHDTMTPLEPGCLPSIDSLLSDPMHRLEASNGFTWYDPMVENETNQFIFSGWNLGIQGLRVSVLNVFPGPLCDSIQTANPPLLTPWFLTANIASGLVTNSRGMTPL